MAVIESPRILAARERAAERARRRARVVRPLIALVFAAEVLPALDAHPRPGLHGAGLTVLCALVVAAAAVAALIARPDITGAEDPASGLGHQRLIAALVVLATAGNLLDALQRFDGALIGLTLVIWLAAANLHERAAATVSALTVLPALVIIALDAHPPVPPALFTALISVLFFAVARGGRRARQELARHELLVAELADLHDAAADTAALAERGRIAREMHDVLAHSLSGLAIQLEAAALMAARERSSKPLQGAVGRARQLAHEGLDEARRAIDALRGERVPGPDALPRLIEDFGRMAEIEVTLSVDGDRRPLPAEAALTVYRVTQEALTNIARHSRAERASVELCYEPAHTRLVIADFGVSDRTPLGEVGAGYGISAMRERAALLDGTVSAASTEDGFRVELVLPR